MKVKKNNGSLQDFNIEKIMLVIEHVSDECNQPLNLSDIKMLEKSILESVDNNVSDVISSVDLRQIVFSVLNQLGFSAIASAYMRGSI